MGESADTAREKLRAKKVPKKPSQGARAFGAKTAIFVPPELQHETGPKPKPPPRQSVVALPPKPRPETITEKRAREKRETHARERLRIGKKISTPTGANLLTAVPVYHPPPSATVPIFGGHARMSRFVHDLGLGLGHVAVDKARGVESWAGEVAAAPGNTLRALLDQGQGAGPRMAPVPIPRSAYKAADVVGKTEPLVRPVGATAKFIGSEKGQEEIWGKSLTNLALHGDTPGGKGEVAGLGFGIVGVLPFGKLTQLAKLGKAARAAGRIGAALPDTPARQAARAVLAQRLGEEEADNAILLLDNAARNTAKSKAESAAHIVEPDDWYKTTHFSAENYAEFKKTPGAKTAMFQTKAGPRTGLIQGASRWVDNPAGDYIPGAGDNVRIPTGGVGLIEDMHGTTATIRMESGKTVDHYVGDVIPVLPDTSAEVPVFKTPDLIQQVNALPEGGLPAAQMQRQFEKAVKPSEFENSGMKDFFDQYPPGQKIPKADVQHHLATSLNAYDLDEVIRRSDEGLATRFGSESQFMGTLTVRDETALEPYVEIAMKLRTPLHTRARRGALADKVVNAPYTGKGLSHWMESDVLGHVRFHIIIDNDGKRALLIDELQSDWASQWRKMKSLGGIAGARAKLGEMTDRILALNKEITYIENNPNPYDTAHVDVFDLEQEGNALIKDREELESFLNAVPGPAPLGEKQIQAMVRRTLRFAHEEGVERIIIVQGDVQSFRNTAFRKTPKGREIDLHDTDAPYSTQEEHGRAWRDDVSQMSHEEIKAYTNDPAHQETGMVKTFFKLYGSKGKKGDIPEIFEKEMGEQGAVKEGIYDGGYSDQMGIVRRSPLPTHRWDGVQYMIDPSHPAPKVGDIVSGRIGMGRVVKAGNSSQVGPANVITVEYPGGSLQPVGSDLVTVMIPETGAGRGHVPMDGFVIEMTPEAHAKAAEPMAYYQTAPNPADFPHGAAELFADGSRAIHLFEGANVSTLIHELAHVSLADLEEVDRAILARHFGGFKSRADHEAYARALERYVYDGMAMESELDGVFAKLKVWMHTVYQHVNQIGAHVHPEVKAVFDRMLVKPETPAEQLVRLLKSAPPVRAAQAAGYSEERGRRIAQMMEAWNTEGGVQEFRAAMHTLKGELPKEAFTGLDELPPEMLESLVATIRQSPKVRGYEKVRAASAVIKATEGGVPTDSELALLNKIFGGEVGFNKVRKNGVDRILVEVWNIPRSLSATLDLSAPLRQGLIAGARHPWLFGKNFPPMFKAAYRAKYAEDVAEDIATRPNATLYQRAKLAVETHASDPSFANREEAFYSSYADKLPVIKQSSRAYETFLHKMRADVFDHMVATARKKGIDVEKDKFLLGAGKYVNSITGRGVMPATELFPFEQAAPFFNTLFFSPRLLASRLNMISPAYYWKLWQHDPFVAKEAMKAMRNTVAGGVTTLLIADQMPGVDVGIDPTSANFGKIRIGDTRVDVLAGFGPLMVLIARLSLGRSTSSTTGKTQNLEGGFGKSSRKDILYRFGESKFAPTSGIFRDVLGGQTFIGEPVTFWGEVKNNAIPMMARDAWEVGHEPSDPTEAVVSAATVIVLGGLGLGFSSYGDRKPKAKSGGSRRPASTDQLPAGWETPEGGPGAEEILPSDTESQLPVGW